MILNFGSINLDLVYRVPHMPAPGETLSATDHQRHLGGKGVNQSIAASHAGAAVRHIGCVGEDGAWVRDQMTGFGLSLEDIQTVSAPTGHAVICVDDAGENQIIIASGANLEFTARQIETSLDQADPNTDWVICQNETNLVHELADMAASKGFKIAYSAAPFDAEHAIPMLDKITLLAVNEGEAAALELALDQDPRTLALPYLLITKGGDGAEVITPDKTYTQSSFPVTPVDTTGAGDTFLGAFVAELTQTEDPAAALRFASAAAAIQVTRPGAAPAIPKRAEVLDFLKANT